MTVVAGPWPEVKGAIPEGVVFDEAASLVLVATGCGGDGWGEVGGDWSGAEEDLGGVAVTVVAGPWPEVKGTIPQGVVFDEAACLVMVGLQQGKSVWVAERIVTLPRDGARWKAMAREQKRILEESL